MGDDPASGSAQGSHRAGPHAMLHPQQHMPATCPCLQRHLPYVGFFQSIGGTGQLKSDHPLDKHASLVREVFGFQEDPR
jgi:hypothetical protein